jgi:hypothetical protein
MKLPDKYIIECKIDGKTYWWNGSKPFVDNINKAFICPNRKSAVKNLAHIVSFYGYNPTAVYLDINV